jgi:hypothetical protein
MRQMLELMYEEMHNYLFLKMSDSVYTVDRIEVAEILGGDSSACMPCF